MSLALHLWERRNKRAEAILGLIISNRTGLLASTIPIGSSYSKLKKGRLTGSLRRKDDFGRVLQRKTMQSLTGVTSYQSKLQYRGVILELISQSLIASIKKASKIFLGRCRVTGLIQRVSRYFLSVRVAANVGFCARRRMKLFN